MLGKVCEAEKKLVYVVLLFKAKFVRSSQWVHECKIVFINDHVLTTTLKMTNRSNVVGIIVTINTVN